MTDLAGKFCLWFVAVCDVHLHEKVMFIYCNLFHNTVYDLLYTAHGLFLSPFMYVDLRETAVRTMYACKDYTALTTQVSGTVTYSCMCTVSVKK